MDGQEDTDATAVTEKLLKHDDAEEEEEEEEEYDDGEEGRESDEEKRGLFLAGIKSLGDSSYDGDSEEEDGEEEHPPVFLMEDETNRVTRKEYVDELDDEAAEEETPFCTNKRVLSSCTRKSKPDKDKLLSSKVDRYMLRYILDRRFKVGRKKYHGRNDYTCLR